MSSIAQQNAHLIQQLVHISTQMDALPYKKRSAYAQQQAELLNISTNTLYKWLNQKIGWRSGRKKRADAGATSLSQKTIEAAAAMQKQALRKNGKHMLSTPTALSLLHQNGYQVPVSASQFNRVMRQQGMSQHQQSRATPHTPMQSLNPNHVHQVDPSLCVIYYMGGRQHMMEADQFYKNKPDNYNKIKLKVWRYVLVDHFSAYVVPWYVEAAGENQANLFEFLMFAWGLQPGRDFHGVPELLVWDKGSANTSVAIQHLCDSLGVRHIPHEQGRARAKGSVECGNNLVERLFEVRLKFEPVDSVDQLNAAACAWSNAYNANCLPRQDTRLNRRGMLQPEARSNLWHQITTAQLRVLPDISVCRNFMVGKSASRPVEGDLTVRYKHPKSGQSHTYDVTGLTGVYVGLSVEVCPMIYGENQITITVPRSDGDDLQYKLDPVNDYNQAGFSEQWPVFGQSFASKPKTQLETVADQLDTVAYGDLSEKNMKKAKSGAVPFGGALDTHSHLKHIQLPDYLPRQGNEITSGERFIEHPMNHIAAAKLLKIELGSTYNAFHLNYLKQHFPEGITTTELDALVAQFTSSTQRIQQEK